MTSVSLAVNNTTSWSLFLLKGLRDLFSEHLLADVEFIVDGVHFPAHRAVLAAATPYFRAMFTHFHWPEARQASIPLGSNGTLRAEVFQIVLEFIYSGEHHGLSQMNGENCQEVYEATFMLQLDGLRDFVRNFMLNRLAFDNCIALYTVAVHYNDFELKRKCRSFIVENARSILSEPHFLETPLPILKRLLRNDDLRIETELEVLTAAVLWLAAQPDEVCAADFEEVLNHIRFHLINEGSVARLGAQIKEHWPQIDCGALARILERLKMYLSTVIMSLPDEGSCESRLELLQPRRGAKACLYIMGGVRGTPTDRQTRALQQVLCLDLWTHQWRYSPSLNAPRSNAASLYFWGTLCLVGGEADGMMAAEFEALELIGDDEKDIESRDGDDLCWVSWEPLTKPRSDLAICALEKQIFVFGGWISPYGVEEAIAAYCLSSRTWSCVGYMPCKRYGLAVLTFSKLIYVAGGFDTFDRPTRQLYSFNPVTGEWLRLADMLQSRAFFGFCALNDGLYAFGGTQGARQPTASMERYDVIRNVWEVQPEMLEPRHRFGAAVSGPCIYVAGGESAATVDIGGYMSQESSLCDTVDCFGADTRRWSRLSVRLPGGGIADCSAVTAPLLSTCTLEDDTDKESLHGAT